MLTMDTRTTQNDLGRLARSYVLRAQPVSGGDSASSASGDQVEAEVRISTSVRDAVRARASEQNQVVTEVARAVIFRAAAAVSERDIQRYKEQRRQAMEEAYATAYGKAESRGYHPEAAKKLAKAAADRAGAARRPLRPYRETRYRLRFTVPREDYEKATTAILASGRTIADAVERGLKAYARTGKL